MAKKRPASIAKRTAPPPEKRRRVAPGGSGGGGGGGGDLGPRSRPAPPAGDAQQQQQRQPRRQQPECLWPASPALRHAARAVDAALAADAARRGGASLKTLTLGNPAVADRDKRAVYAVAVETLKARPLLAALAAAPGVPPCVLGAMRPGAAYVLIREMLLSGASGGLRPSGPAERAVLAARAPLEAALAARLAAAGAAGVPELLAAEGGGAAAAAARALATRPRAARVNTLKMSVADALAWLRAPPPPHAALGGAAAPAVDGLLPEVLLFPPGADLHAHPLVTAGALVLQGRSSCMPAVALAPRPGWHVLDACAAPGNKTTHLAAVMAGRGRVTACDRDPARLARLRAAAAAAGAERVIEPRLADFLALDPAAPEFGSVRAVLVDPSCSGSGTAASRGDWLLPSAGAGGGGGGGGGGAGGSAGGGFDGGGAGGEGDDSGPGDEEGARVERLARFQEAALRHALAFPAAERVAYSTCSVHARENEAVVAAALGGGGGRAAGWALAPALPAWPRRGCAAPGLSAAEAGALVRVDPVEDGAEGFFVALFVRPRGGQ